MITGMNFRISGRVAYSDGTSGDYDVVRQDDQFIGPGDDDLAHFRAAWAQDNVPIKALLQSLGGHWTITPPAPAGKTIVDWTFNFSGQISRSDGSSNTFMAIRDRKGGSVVTNASVFTEVLADTTYRGYVKSGFILLAGAGHVTLTA